MVITDRLVAAILEANATVPDVTFLALLGRPATPITLCMCADYLIPLTLYEGEVVADALIALDHAVSSLQHARKVL